MHDVGIIVWAAIVVIGMVASIVSTARKAAAPATRPGVRLQRQTPAPQRPVAAPQWQPQASQWQPQAPQWPPPDALQWPQRQAVPAAASPKPKPPSPAPRAAAQAALRPQPQASDHEFPLPSHGRRAILGDAGGLRRAVIAAEVLGKPLALRDE